MQLDQFLSISQCEANNRGLQVVRLSVVLTWCQTPFNGSIEVGITAEDLRNNDPDMLHNLLSVILALHCAFLIRTFGNFLLLQCYCGWVNPRNVFTQNVILKMNKLSAAQSWRSATFGGGDFFQSTCANSPQVASVLHTKSCTGGAFPSIL